MYKVIRNEKMVRHSFLVQYASECKCSTLQTNTFWVVEEDQNYWTDTTIKFTTKFCIIT